MIGAQLYTLRDYTKTPADIAKTLSRVRKMGYDAVQASALGPIEPKELKKIMDGEGLVCAATHASLDRMRDQPQAVIEEHQIWNCKLTAIGGFWPKEPTARDWIEFAHRYSEIARKFEGSGVSIGYHNHSHELAHFNGKPALSLLLENFSQSVWMEIDTYWITHGGGDPAEWIRRCKGRIPAVHLKDMGIKYADKQQFMMEVGQGNLNWTEILKACKDAGVQWYLVEQDVCYRDPFESLEMSLKNLRAMGL